MPSRLADHRSLGGWLRPLAVGVETLSPTDEVLASWVMVGLGPGLRTSTVIEWESSYASERFRRS